MCRARSVGDCLKHVSHYIRSIPTSRASNRNRVRANSAVDSNMSINVGVVGMGIMGAPMVRLCSMFTNAV